MDEGTIIKRLAERTNSERQQIKAAYQQQTGKVDRNLNHKIWWVMRQLQDMEGENPGQVTIVTSTQIYVTLFRNPSIIIYD